MYAILISIWHGVSCYAGSVDGGGKVKNACRHVAAASTRDSTGEWVRCMKLAEDGMLFLSTNQGLLHSLQLPNDVIARSSSRRFAHTTSVSSSASKSAWTCLYRSPRKAATTCMQILDADRQCAQADSQIANTLKDGHCIVFGDGLGHVTCIMTHPAGMPSRSRHSNANSGRTSSHPGHSDDCSQQQPGSTPADLSLDEFEPMQPEQQVDAAQEISWVAHEGKPVLAIFQAPALGSRHVFTTTSSGAPMRWWLLPGHTSSSAATFQVAATHQKADVHDSSSVASAGHMAQFQQAAHHSDLASLLSSASKLPASSASEHHLDYHTPASSSSGSHALQGPAPVLLAEVVVLAGRGSQIVAVAACPQQGALVCGDLAGNVMAFPLSASLLEPSPPGLFILCAQGAPPGSVSVHPLCSRSTTWQYKCSSSERQRVSSGSMCVLCGSQVNVYSSCNGS